MFEKILVPLDGSELSEIVVPYVRELARRVGSQVTLLHVCSPQDVHYCHMTQVYLEKIANLLREGLAADKERKVEVDSVIVTGEVAVEILKYAESNAFNIIAMSTHGRTGIQRWVLGSIADKLSRGSSIPLLLVRNKVPERVPADRWPAKGILVPLDGSDTGEAALPYATELSKSLNKELVLLQVISTDYRVAADPGGPYIFTEKDLQSWKTSAATYLESIANKLRAGGVSSRIQVSMGISAQEINKCARECGVDLIAMSAHGHSGITRFILGSVTANVLQNGETPLLLVSPSAARQASAK